MSNELMAPEAIAERNRIRDALRRIAARYQANPQSGAAELIIRRAIEEIFDTPVSNENNTIHLPARACR